MSLRYPVTGYRLGNGMRVLVSADRLTPVAALHVHHAAAQPWAGPALPAGYRIAAGSAEDLPRCAFHRGRLDPRVLRVAMWAEADRMAAEGLPAAGAVLAVAGDADPAQLIRDAGKYFGRLPAGTRPAGPGGPAPGPVPPEGGDGGPPWPAAEFGFRLPAYSVRDESYFAAGVALRIAAGGPGSRAHRALVHVTRAACDVRVRIRPAAGAFSSGTVVVLLAPGGGDVAGKILTAVLRELADSGPGAEELAGARADAEQDALRVLAIGTGRVFHLACLADGYPDPAGINSIDDRIRSVTRAQVRQAAAAWLDPAAATGLSGPPREQP